jgi:hypothetical protein
MTSPKLPLEDTADQPARDTKPKFTIETLLYEQTRVSIYNPRHGVAISDESLAPLAPKSEPPARSTMPSAGGQPTGSSSSTPAHDAAR